MSDARARQLRTALGLGYFTVVYNVVEGAVAVAAGAAAGSGALVGFGLDSAVESLSALVLIWRLRVEQSDPDRAEHVEQRAVRLIGVTFFLLAAYVGYEAITSLIERAEPDSSIVGILLTSLSLVVMPVLARRKRVVGTEMASRAGLADAATARRLSGHRDAGLRRDHPADPRQLD